MSKSDNKKSKLKARSKDRKVIPAVDLDLEVKVSKADPAPHVEALPQVIEFSDNELQVDRGTFCGVIGQQLAVSVCPLPSGSCMWKHRQSGRCTFTNVALTAHQFATLVGLPPVDGAFVNVLRSTLKNKVYKEMSR